MAKRNLEDLKAELNPELWMLWKDSPVTQALLLYLREEKSSLLGVLSNGHLLGGANDKLAQDYASIVGRLTQIAHILTLDLETLINLLPESEEDE